MIVAFDFDGTICDSMGELEDLAVNVIRRYWDVADEEIIRQRYRETSGDPFDVQLPKIMSTNNSRDIHYATAEYAVDKINVTIQSQPKKAVIAAVVKLIEAGVGIHIISSTTSPLIRLWLRTHFERLEHLVHCHGIDMGTKVENLARCMPDWFVGDSESDLQRALQNAIPFFYVDQIDLLLSAVLS